MSSQAETKHLYSEKVTKKSNSIRKLFSNNTDTLNDDHSMASHVLEAQLIGDSKISQTDSRVQKEEVQNKKITKSKVIGNYLSPNVEISSGIKFLSSSQDTEHTHSKDIDDSDSSENKEEEKTSDLLETTSSQLTPLKTASPKKIYFENPDIIINTMKVHQIETKLNTELLNASASKRRERGTTIKNLLRDFKKYYVKDFAVFTRSIKDDKDDKDLTFLSFYEKVQKYIISRGFGLCTEESHYYLALVLDPKSALNCFRKVTLSSEQQNE
jgi:hypothetical protein